MRSSSGTTHRRFRHAFIGTAAFAACAVLSGVRSDPEFMRYDAAARRVTLTIIAAFDQSNSGYNFNGGFRGSHVITIPAGWRVELTLVNRDVISHSVAVIRDVQRLPLRIEQPAIPGASSRAPQNGVRAGGREDDITFVADHPGAYLIACGVTGHTVHGSYLRLLVSETATVPTYVIDTVATRSIAQR
jgi:sulfocyanin